MAARQAQVLTESDGDDEGGVNNGGPLPGGPIQNGTTLADIGNVPARGTNSHPQARAAEPADFEIVEVDDNLQPIEAPRHEARLDEGGTNEGTYLEQQQQPAAGQEGEHQQPGRKSKRRANHRAGRDRNLAELDAANERIRQLEDQIGTISPRLSQIDESRVADQLATMDREITGHQVRFESARERIKTALAEGDGEALVKAMDERDQAVMSGQQLLARRNMLATGSPTGEPMQRREEQQQPQQRQGPQPLAPEVQAYVRDFANDHDWYNPTDPRSEGFDDSQIVRALDEAVGSAAARGTSPRSSAAATAAATEPPRSDDRWRCRSPRRAAGQESGPVESSPQGSLAPCGCSRS